MDLQHHTDAHRAYVDGLLGGSIIPIHDPHMMGKGLGSFFSKAWGGIKKFGRKALPYIMSGVKVLTDDANKEKSLAEKLGQVVSGAQKVDVNTLAQELKPLAAKAADYLSAHPKVQKHEQAHGLLKHFQNWASAKSASADFRNSANSGKSSSAAESGRAHTLGHKDASTFSKALAEIGSSADPEPSGSRNSQHGEGLRNSAKSASADFRNKKEKKLAKLKF